jgi:hypothetical protein
MALAEILMLGRMLPLVETSLDKHFTVHRVAAADVAALPADLCARIQAVAGGAHVPVNAALIDRLPSLEIVATNSLRDIRRREADIAIRHVEPQDGELIARRMPDMQARLYASRDLIARRGGPPHDAAALSAWPFVGFERSDRFRLALNALGLSLTQGSFPLASENGVVAWHYVRAGLGVGAMIEEVARLSPEVECVLPELPAIPVPVFLVTHRELRTSRRIRIVFDHIMALLAGD